MNLQKGTRVKLTEENNLFYLSCSVLELKMSFDSVQLDSARKWHRRLVHLKQAHVVRNAACTRDSGGMRWYMQCMRIGQDHKDSNTKSGKDPSRREAGEGVHRRVGLFRAEPLSGFRFCIVFADQYTKFVFMDLLQAKSEALASL